MRPRFIDSRNRFIEKTKTDLETYAKRSKVKRIIQSEQVGQALSDSTNTLNDIIRDLNVSLRFTRGYV
jgi:hypothetical protein